MNVQLPAERELSEPNLMVDRILAQTPRQLPTRRHRTRVLISVAAVAAATTVAVVGVGVISHRRAEVGPAPRVIASPQPPSPTKRPATTVMGGTVTFADLTVRVHSAQQIKVNGAPADEYTIFVTTCVRDVPPGDTTGRLRLSAGSFTLTTSSATITVDDPIRMPVPLPTTYPADGSYRVGQCVSGVIPFGVDHTSTVRRVEYANSFGNTASWIP